MISYPSDIDATPENLGGKGMSLITMTQMGLKVPRAFIMPVSHKTGTERYALYRQGIIECFSGLNDVLYSVRSGAPVSMPGMCDTFLHVGLTPNKLKRLELLRGVPFAKRIQSDSYQYFGSTKILPKDQIVKASNAVADSWNSDKAKAFRTKFGVPNTGTAIILQQMVFGLGPDSGSGVFFSHDLTTGSEARNGAFVANEAGEALVNGTTNGEVIDDTCTADWYEDLVQGCELLQEHYGAPVDIEFTVDQGDLYFLQARPAKLTAQAKIKNYQMPNIKITGADLDACAVSVIKPGHPADLTGTAIAGGAVQGKVARTEGQAKTYIKQGTPFIYVREDTTPEDLPVMLKAVGLITKVGSHTSHAALCARALNLPCVINVNLDEMVNDKTITMCGSTGRIVYGDDAPVVAAGLPLEVAQATIHYMAQVKTPTWKAVKIGDVWGDHKLPTHITVIKSKTKMQDFDSMLTKTDSHKLAQIQAIYEEQANMSKGPTKAIQEFLGKVEEVLTGPAENHADIPYIEEIVLEALNDA